MAARVDHYAVLEVSPRASEAVIEAAYRTLCNVYRDNPKQLLAVRAAGRVLLDPKEKKKYDKDVNGGKGAGKRKIIGNYEVIEQLAEGGFGVTYRAKQRTIDSNVCIKHALYVSPEDEAILLEEAQSIWDLRHYGIPAMRDIIRLDDKSLAIVMSYIPGPTLAQVIEKNGGLDPEHVAWITERVLNVLKYLHYNGVVHGDVKPQNIIVQPEQHMAVVVDYGLSLIRPSGDSKNKGYTPYFASPEQIAGGTLVPESDLYSLAVTMIYALGGSVDGLKVPEDTPEPMCDFIKRLLKHNVLARPHWDKEDLMETLQTVRLDSFGRRYSNLKELKV